MAQAADLERGNGQLREQSSRQADLLAASEAAKAELEMRLDEHARSEVRGRRRLAGTRGHHPCGPRQRDPRQRGPRQRGPPA